MPQIYIEAIETKYDTFSGPGVLSRTLRQAHFTYILTSYPDSSTPHISALPIWIPSSASLAPNNY